MKSFLAPYQPHWPALRAVWFCDFTKGCCKGLGFGLGVVVGVCAGIGWAAIVYHLINWLLAILKAWWP